MPLTCPKPRRSATLTWSLNPQLRELIEAQAQKAGLPVSRFLADLVAQSLGKPKLAASPFKRGRPRSAG